MAAAVGIVVHLLLLVEGVIPDLVGLDANDVRSWARPRMDSFIISPTVRSKRVIISILYIGTHSLDQTNLDIARLHIGLRQNSSTAGIIVFMLPFTLRRPRGRAE